MSGNHGGAVVSPPEGFVALLRFNFLPWEYMDASWWQPDWLSPDLVARLRHSDRARRRLSAFVLRRFGLSDALDLDFSIEKKRLALLDSARLQRLVRLAGLVLQSGRIARLIRREERQAVRDAMGEPDYLLALKRGAFLLREAGVKTPPNPDEALNFASCRRDCYRLGVGCLATAMQDMPRAFVGRLQFKLPKPFVDEDWTASAPGTDTVNAASRLFLVLDRETTAS